MGRVTIIEIAKIFTFVVTLNVIVALISYAWITNEDMKGLPSDAGDRIASIFYFFVTTTGYGDVYPVSVRLKVFAALYAVIMVSGILSFLFDF
jgi:hypothetical protein